MGFGNSIQKHFYLPEPQTDFIFSIISEEFGFVGILIVATLFLTIIITGFNEMIIENFKGILEYEEFFVRINTHVHEIYLENTFVLESCFVFLFKRL